MIFTRKSQSQFIEKRLFESTATLCNPSRGWYRIYSFSLDERLDFEELTWCLCKEETLALVIVDIGAFRAQAISEEALGVFFDILQFFSDNEKEIILRIVYDRDGHGMEREPDFQSLMEEHMHQLGSIVRGFADNIFLSQGLFVGSWGEMHDSKFLSKERLQKLLSVWREVIGDEIAIAVRTPQQWRFLYNENADCGKIAMVERVGLFDDGMFGSYDNLGTYGINSRREVGWEERWCREDELVWMHPITRYIPYGGEAVGTSEAGALQTAVVEMRQNHLTYLNHVHDAKRLDAWARSTWQETGVWNGCSGLDYIGCHLGYRFVLRKVKLGKIHGGEYLSLQIENVGFAPMMEEVQLLLIFAAENQERISQIYPCDLHHLDGGEQMTIDLKLPELEQGRSYEVFFQVSRKRDGKVLFLANEPVSESICLGTITKV